MARLPQTGGDAGNWGSIVNDYLSQAHKSDGTLKDDSVTKTHLTPTLRTELDTKITESTANAAFAPITAQTEIEGRLSESELSSRYAPAVLGIITPEMFGAVGDGISDDTAALNAALASSATTNRVLVADPQAIYRVSQSGTKTFTTGTGSTFVAPFCIQIPTGSRVNWRNASLKVAPSFNGVVLSNVNTSIAGDKVEIIDAVIDGGGVGVGANRGFPSVILWGLSNSTVLGLRVTETSYIAASIAFCSNSIFDLLSVDKIRGQGIMLGNGLSDLNSDCKFGTLIAENVSDFGTFSQPGNGFCLGLVRSSIERIVTRNCSGGIKYLKGCDDVHTVYAEFDGTVLGDESNNAAANSGVKVQGDDVTAKAGRVTFDKIVSRFCAGSGLYVRFAKRVKIVDYNGYKNARLGLNDDVDLAEFEDLEIASISSENAGLGGVTITTNGSQYKFGRVTVRDFGDVTPANSFGFTPLQGHGRVNYLAVFDDRQTQIVSKAIHAVNDVQLHVDNYRTNVGNRVDIRSPKIFLGNPILSSGNSPLSGAY